MTRVLMLLSNPYRPDPRVKREMEALATSGYQVSLVCWDRQGELPVRETNGGIEVQRLQGVRSSYGLGWRQFFYLPRFWSQAVRGGEMLQPDIVHCHDLDTLAAGMRLKRRLGCRLVYDAHEDYPSLMSLYLPGPLIPLLRSYENRLLRGVDAVITASTVLAEKMRLRTPAPVQVIGNYPRLAEYAAVTPADAAGWRNQLGLQKDEKLAAYIGGFSRNRLLLPFIEASRELPGWQVRLWGDGHQRPAVEQALQGSRNIRYLGWAPPEQVPLYTCSADVLYYCLKPDYPGAIYNAPNSLANAMLAGRPLIANDVGDLGRIVRETGCGLAPGAGRPGHGARRAAAARGPGTACSLGGSRAGGC